MLEEAFGQPVQSPRALAVEINLQINSVEVNITETLKVINSRGRKILQFCEGINMRHFEWFINICTV